MYEEKNIPTLIKQKRLEHGLRLQEVANYLSVSKAFVSVLERGVRPVPERIRPLLGTLLGVDPKKTKPLRPKAADKPWRSGRVPRNFWQDEDNIMAFIQDLADHYGFNQLDDWFEISKDHFKKIGGNGLLHEKFQGSVIKAVEFYFPQKDLPIWMFKNVTMNYWENKKNIKKYLEWLFKRLGYRSLKQKHGLTANNLKNNKGHTPLSLYSINDLLEIFFGTETLHRAKWNLSKTYPVTALNYSLLRSEIAFSIGLGKFG